MVLKRCLFNFQSAELLTALPPVAGHMRPSELMDKMKALALPEELERPSSLFLHTFLTRIPADIRAHCLPFANELLADVAQHADVQFLACPRPAAQPQVYLLIYLERAEILEVVGDVKVHEGVLDNSTQTIMGPY